MCTKIYAVDRLSNLRVCSLGSHSDPIIGCFFEKDSLDIITISRNGQLCVWESNLDLDSLIPWVYKNKNVENDFDEVETNPEETVIKESEKEDVLQEKATVDTEKVSYKRLDRMYLRDALKESKSRVDCTSACYHQRTKILVTGFSNGAFLLHEMPELNLIHSLSLSENSIDAININFTGDWIALASSNLGQLVVWEWQSESFVMKQQGHFNNMNCVTYSPDGQFIVTGGDDGKVKLWNTDTGFCFATFNEHKASVSSVCFTQSGKVILSASLDGTVRAYDIKKYRNFKTFSSFPPSQFSCLAVDSSGTFVCAASSDTFKVFVWSMVNGSLLEVLTGHEAPISGISFSPTQAILLSSSWDKTVRVWDVFESKGGNEAISTITDGKVYTFFLLKFISSHHFLVSDISDVVQVGSIDGRKDLGLSAKDTDVVTSRKLQFGRAFNAICYNADGEFILAAGNSRFICIYNVAETILLKKFEITCNLSLDGVNEMINRRRMTEFGNIALIEDRSDNDFSTINLPGVKKGDMASRAFKPEIKITCIQFSPTGKIPIIFFFLYFRANE
ncbi:Periodic tryptophan protein 2 [Nymphon striatum]|nr:Periodic tryptophan protein 2 [Nymphon striatum]